MYLSALFWLVSLFGASGLRISNTELEPFHVSECPKGLLEGDFSTLPESTASPPRVLVAILSSTRAEELTYDSFRRYLLDPLNADLALAVSETGGGAHSVRNGPYYRRAKFIWEVPEPSSNDYGPLFDNIGYACHNHTFQKDLKNNLIPHGNWLGGIRSCRTCAGSGAIQMWFRFFLWQNLVKSGLLSKYETLILTRSDHLYIAPHPPIHRMQQDQVLAVSGMDGFGLCDRHFIIPMKGAELFLGMAAHVTDKSARKIFGTSRHEFFLDAETSIRRYLHWHNIKVARFRRVMFLVRDPADNDNTWCPGKYDDSAGYIVKYPPEYEDAQATAKWLAQQNNDWGNFAPAYSPMSLDGSANARVSAQTQQRDACE